MTPSVDFTAITKTKWHEYAVRFALGGAVTVIAGVLAKHFGPGFGGLFLAFPAIFPASATLVEKHERKGESNRGGKSRGRRAAALEAAGAAMGSIALMSFALVVSKILPDGGAGVVLSSATAVWLVVSVVIWRVERIRHRRRAFTTPLIR